MEKTPCLSFSLRAILSKLHSSQNSLAQQPINPSKLIFILGEIGEIIFWAYFCLAEDVNSPIICVLMLE